MVKKMRKMKIKRKLITGFLMVAIIASLSGLIGVVMMYVIDTQYSSALVNYGFAQGDVGKLLAILGKVDGDVHDVISYLDDASMNKAIEAYDTNSVEVQGYLDAVVISAVSEDEKEYANQMETYWAQYQTKAEEIMVDGKTSDAQIVRANQDILVQELDPIYNNLYTAAANMMISKVSEGERLSTSLTSFVLIVILVVVVIIVLSIFACIKISAAIASSLSSSINSCVDRLVLVSE